MKNCIMIPGKPSKAEYFSKDHPSPSNHHWFPWIQKQLVMKGILTQVLEMPTPYAPVYEEWKKVLELFPLDMTFSLVGHSCGGGFLLRYLSEHKISVSRLVLVAPWLDPIKHVTGDFFKFKHDPALLSKVSSLHILYSTDDISSGVKESVSTIYGWYPKAIVHEFVDSGHFTVKEMHTAEFPELLDIIVGV